MKDRPITDKDPWQNFVKMYVLFSHKNARI